MIFSIALNSIIYNCITKYIMIRIKCLHRLNKAVCARVWVCVSARVRARGEIWCLNVVMIDSLKWYFVPLLERYWRYIATKSKYNVSTIQNLTISPRCLLWGTKMTLYWVGDDWRCLRCKISIKGISGIGEINWFQA